MLGRPQEPGIGQAEPCPHAACAGSRGLWSGASRGWSWTCRPVSLSSSLLAMLRWVPTASPRPFPCRVGAAAQQEGPPQPSSLRGGTEASSRGEGCPRPPVPTLLQDLREHTLLSQVGNGKASQARQSPLSCHPRGPEPSEHASHSCTGTVPLRSQALAAHPGTRALRHLALPASPPVNLPCSVSSRDFKLPARPHACCCPTAPLCSVLTSFCRACPTPHPPLAPLPPSPVWLVPVWLRDTWRCVHSLQLQAEARDVASVL